MNTYKLSNIPLRKFRTFLFEVGCERVSTSGGHEKWDRDGLERPITLQSHIDPVPEHVVQNTLRCLGMTKKEFFNIYYTIDQ